MTARNSTRSNDSGHQFDPGTGAFPRYQQRQAAAAAWEPIDLGGHEVVARLHMELKHGAEAVGEGRHALDPLDGAIDTSELEVLRLLVTELITNSVRHAGAASWIGLDVEIYSNSVRVSVTDRGAGFEAPETPVPHIDRPGGWGLCLVDRLSNRWGVARNGRTSVWFEVDRADRHSLAA
jgi:anti-sigma regulatory factor (Ser/Thr protein kinase)